MFWFVVFVRGTPDCDILGGTLATNDVIFSNEFVWRARGQFRGNCPRARAPSWLHHWRRDCATGRIHIPAELYHVTSVSSYFRLSSSRNSASQRERETYSIRELTVHHSHSL